MRPVALRSPPSAHRSSAGPGPARRWARSAFSATSSSYSSGLAGFTASNVTLAKWKPVFYFRSTRKKLLNVATEGSARLQTFRCTCLIHFRNMQQFPLPLFGVDLHRLLVSQNKWFQWNSQFTKCNFDCRLKEGANKNNKHQPKERKEVIEKWWQ